LLEVKAMSYVAVAIVIGMLIAIHEYGHLLAAKLCRIPVRRFSIGFGPKLFGFKFAETSYWLSWIPLGGYVLPALEDAEFRQLPAYKRITFALGGPIANITGAFVGLFVIGLSQLSLGPIKAVSFAATQLMVGMQQQLYGLSAFVDFGQLSGIVGIVAVGGSEFGSTLAGLLTFSVLINISLAFLNLLPLPPLDGGRILFCVLEKLYRPIAKVEAPVTLVGWALVMVLMICVTVKDVGRIVT
jgi:regulator of sigma E protease